MGLQAERESAKLKISYVVTKLIRNKEHIECPTQPHFALSLSGAG